SLELQTIKLTPDGLTQTASVFLETSMPTHDDMARFSYARDESTLASPRLCISRGDSINCSGFGPEANGWLLRLPPVLQALHGFSMPPIALTPMLDKLADTSMGTIRYRRTQRYPSSSEKHAFHRNCGPRPCRIDGSVCSTLQAAEPSDPQSFIRLTPAPALC